MNYIEVDIEADKQYLLYHNRFYLTLWILDSYNNWWHSNQHWIPGSFVSNNVYYLYLQKMRNMKILSKYSVVYCMQSNVYTGLGSLSRDTLLHPLFMFTQIKLSKDGIKFRKFLRKLTLVYPEIVTGVSTTGLHCLSSNDRRQVISILYITKINFSSYDISIIF